MELNLPLLAAGTWVTPSPKGLLQLQQFCGTEKDPGQQSELMFTVQNYPCFQPGTRRDKGIFQRRFCSAGFALLVSQGHLRVLCKAESLGCRSQRLAQRQHRACGGRAMSRIAGGVPGQGASPESSVRASRRQMVLLAKERGCRACPAPHTHCADNDGSRNSSEINRHRSGWGCSRNSNGFNVGAVGLEEHRQL